MNAPELKDMMIALRTMMGVSLKAKQLFREKDSDEKDLAGYAAIRWSSTLRDRSPAYTQLLAMPTRS